MIVTDRMTDEEREEEKRLSREKWAFTKPEHKTQLDPAVLVALEEEEPLHK